MISGEKKIYCHQNKALGEVMMKRLIMTSVILITMFGVVGAAHAVRSAKSTNNSAEIREDGITELQVLAELDRQERILKHRAERAEREKLAAMAEIGNQMNPDASYVCISTTPNKIDFGTVLGFGDHDLDSVMTVNINSNCVHGSVIASFSPFKNSEGDTIKSNRMYVQSPMTDGYVSMARPVVISKQTEGNHSFDLSFKVKTDLNDRCGKYEGSLTFTVVPPSY